MEQPPINTLVNAGQIPEDLKTIPHWLNWIPSYIEERGKYDKIPRTPAGSPASHSDPETWSDFETVLAAAQEAADCGKKEGIGFVLTMESGITAIDLDNCIDPEDDLADYWAVEIVLKMDTYTEVSPSGKGFRLFVRGTIPADHLANGQQGRKKQNIEIYGGLRYVTVTGQHYHGTPTTVESRQDELTALCGEHFNKPTARKESVPNPGNGNGKPTEAQLVALKKHKNFTDTWKRERKDLEDQSASSYDLALANMAVEAGFTDECVASLIELWREEQGEDTDKLNRPDYLANTISKARSKLRVEEVSIHVSERLPDHIPDYQEEAATPFPYALLHPPGLIGDMVDSMRAHGRRDQPVLAVSGAFSALAAFSGNHYIVMPDKTPLSPYSINVAATGSGKESTRDWIREAAYSVDAQLINCVRDSVSSSAAILRHLESDKTLLLMQDEFGRQLQQAQGKEGSHAMGAITELMSLYGKGAGVHTGRAYAEKDKNIEPILHPFVTLMATTTSTELMAVIKGADVDSGFLNRCMLFETAENIPPRQSPVLDIDQKIIVALRHVGNGTHGGQASIKINGIDFVPITASSAALVLINELADMADEMMATPPYGALWARAYQNALIYSGLLALGCGGKLIITEEHAVYAILLVKHCITRWTKKMKEESSESVFDGLQKKALKIIRHARKYSHDKKYGDLCSQGFMPRSKLINQMRLDKHQLNRIVDTLLESEEIGQSEIGLSGKKQICVYFPKKYE